MTTATDTPEERRAAYERLFERALLGREERDGVVVFRLRAGERTRAELEELTRTVELSSPAHVEPGEYKTRGAAA